MPRKRKDHNKSLTTVCRIQPEQKRLCKSNLHLIWIGPFQRARAKTNASAIPGIDGMNKRGYNPRQSFSSLSLA